MSEESDTEPFETNRLIGAWLLYEQYRKGIEEKIKGLELSSFNMNFNDAKTEKTFRARLAEIQVLLDKILRLLGPEKEARTLVA